MTKSYSKITGFLFGLLMGFAEFAALIAFRVIQ
jgi:hypothetical protein